METDNSRQRVQPGKHVELGYELFQVNSNGTEVPVHQTSPDDPEQVVFGVTPGMIRPLEAAIDGLEKGDTFDVTVRADDAFGPYDPDRVSELERDIFLVDGKFDEEVIREGALLPMMTADGFRIDGRVLEVTPTHVRLDFNHPLAGKDVRFKGSILGVRDATPEELHPAHGCGCGCDHDHCDSGCSDGCHC